MNCPAEDMLLKAELGEIAVNDLQELDNHVGACEVCRIARSEIRLLLRELATAPEPEPASLFVDRVMVARSRVAGRSWAQDSIGRWRRRRWGVHAAVFAAAAGVAAIALAFGTWRIVGIPSRGHDVISARGAVSSGRSSTDPAAEVLVVRGDQLLQASGRSLGPGDAFAVRYTHRANEPYFFAAFAVDAARTVHWIYPEYVDEATDPPSVPLPFAQLDRLLPEVVQPDSPARGPMQVVSLVSREPVSVKQIEAELRKASPAQPLSAIFREAVVREWSCSWDVP
jgi:hypothetical protein